MKSLECTEKMSDAIKENIIDVFTNHSAAMNELFLMHSTLNPDTFVTLKSESESRFSKNNVDIVILTATPIETNMILNAMRQQNTNKIEKIRAENGRAYHLSRLGEYNIAHIQSPMGSGAKETASLAIKKWNPKIIISYGIALGETPNKQKLGDVIFPTLIISYRDGKYSDGEIFVSKNAWVPNTDAYIRNFIDEYGTHCKPKHGFNLHSGTIIESPWVLSDPDLKEKFFSSIKSFRAIGGDMEAHGIYEAVQDSEREFGKKYCFMLKGVCDWAEEKNENVTGDEDEQDKIQLFAANNALVFLMDLLNDRYFLSLDINSSENTAAITRIKDQFHQHPKLIKKINESRDIIVSIYSYYKDTYKKDQSTLNFLNDFKEYGYCNNEYNLTEKGFLFILQLTDFNPNHYYKT
ncbi:MAG: hypothetical protein FWD44_00085 [Oscillospiraceae bacterium]|nr:hypothetical protein [Oscillospiraceae bacterium]